jgi:release factor glutamine methyltransferase
MNVTAALQAAQGTGANRTDARYLLCYLLGVDRAWLIQHDDANLPPETATRFAALCQRLAAGEPLAYLTGEREFHGLRLAVAPGVLIPRPDTEVLVDWALDCLRARHSPHARVIDLGTGSGAVALAIAHRHPNVQVLATDVSPAALDQARANAHRLGLTQVAFCAGSWWAAVAAQTFDLAVSNPPYIAGDDPHLVALRHEPRAALTPGGDGLDDLRRLCADAGRHLNPGAWLLLEHGWDQGAAVRTLLRQAGFAQVQSRLDLAGHTRCSGGCWLPGV